MLSSSTPLLYIAFYTLFFFFHTKSSHIFSCSVISLFNFKTIVGKRDDEIWVYINGIYEPIGKNIIKARVEQRLNKICKTHHVNEVINKIARKTFITREKFCCENPNLICVNNGVLDLKTRKLKPHSPDYFFATKIPVSYDKKATCHKILQFLSEVLNDEDVKAIQEWIGYHLYREYFMKKALIFRGVPDTGKTTFLNLLIKFIGGNNVANKSLQLLAQGKWQLVKLYNKHANIGDDLTNDDVSNMGVVKQLTGRSSIDAEEKFGDSFGFINYAKLSFGCNKIPRIQGDVDDRAFWDRWMIFDFENVFERTDDNTRPNIINEIATDEEMSGLLNWGIEGLKRLQKQGYFSYQRTWEDNRRIMQGEASSVARFNNECLLYDSSSWVSNSDLYHSYNEFCELNMITNIETIQKFAKDIRRYCNFATFNINRNNIFGVKNIKVKSVLPIMGL